MGPWSYRISVLLRDTRGASQVAQVTKNQPANAGDAGDLGSIPALGRSPGVGIGNPLQYSCLENPTDRGAWWATVHGVAESQTGLSTHTHTQEIPQSWSFSPPFSPPRTHAEEKLCEDTDKVVVCKPGRRALPVTKEGAVWISNI